MFELVIIIIAIRATYKEAKKSQLNPWPYVLSCIFLSVLSSGASYLLFGSVMGAIFSIVLTLLLSFIPFIVLTSKESSNDSFRNM